MAAATPAFLNAAALSRFSRLELMAQSVVEGFMTGLHKSPFKGFAIEFAEHRQYVPGDDVKHLDWKLLGKQNRYYIKQYEEDTSLRCWMLLDCSGSMAYGDVPGAAKFDYARYICAMFSFLALQQGDAVGMATFDGALRDYLPPHSTRRHLKVVLDTLSASVPGKDTGIGPVLHGIADRIHRRGLIVLVSDFFDDPDAIIRALNHFAKKHHEVIAFQVLDRREIDFPFTDMTRFECLETGSDRLVDPIRVRRAYIERFKAHQRRLREACHALRFDFVEMVTDEPFERQIAAYLTRRLRR